MTDKAKVAAHLRGMLDELTQPTGIEAIVCADIAKRQRMGIAKYGTTVADNPLSLREWLEHQYFELLDAAIYCRRAMAEIDVRGDDGK